MGQSTNGILVYGIDYGEEFPIEIDADDSNSYDDRMWELIEEFDGQAVDIVRHCSGDYPMYIVGIGETIQSARRGYPTEVEHAKFTINNMLKWDSMIRAFCEKHKIEYKQPELLLASMWN